MVKSLWWGGMGWGGGVGGPCDFGVTPSPNWTWILIFDWFGVGLTLRGPDLGLGLDNIGHHIDNV